MTQGQLTKRSGYRQWLPAVSIAILGVAILLRGIASHLTPMVRDRAIQMLRDRFDSEAEIHDFQVTVFPGIVIKGSGLTLRHQGRTDVPPLISIREFRAEPGLLGLIGKPWHIQKIHVDGLAIRVPPPDRNRNTRPRETLGITVLVDELVSENAELDVLPKDPDKLPHVFLIRHLIMKSVGLGHAASFKASLTNPAPPGEIEATGHFGPWQRDQPSLTPLSAAYSFKNADLSSFRGIGGILSSEGNFHGVLEEIEVEGQTDTPDFRVNIGGHPIELRTQFKATVNGTNGNTLLHPVVAQFLRSALTASGGVTKAESGKGREIVLHATAENARLEDLLLLVVKAGKALITGSVRLKVKFRLPPGNSDIIDRLRLDGEFGVGGAEFTRRELRERVKALSRRGQGKPTQEDAASAVSALQGRFILQDGVIRFPSLTFRVTGASVQLSGHYGLRSEDIDFHGTLRLKAKLSRTMTGLKSIFLKPFDPFFRKQGATVLPIKITGTRDNPTFGLDLGHKQEEGKGQP